MGVKNLWKLLDSAGIEEIPTGKNLAIDISIWIHQLSNNDTKSSSERFDYNILFINRIIKLLYNDINPIFVFDGAIPPLKKRTILDRRANLIAYEHKKVVKGIIENRICKICNIKLRICEHGGELRSEIFQKSDLLVNERIKNHKYNWGDEMSEIDDISEGSQECLNEKSNYDSQEYLNQRSNYDLQEYLNSNHSFNSNIKDYDFSAFETVNNLNGLTKTEKTQLLLKIRSKRKEPMPFNNSNPMDFVLSQLENVIRRNTVNILIKNLNNERRIQSDCKREVIFKKERLEMNNKINNSTDNLIDNLIDNSTDKNLLSIDQELIDYKSIIEKYQNSKNVQNSKDIQEDDICDQTFKEFMNQNELIDEIKKYLNEKYNTASVDNSFEIFQNSKGSEIVKNFKKILDIFNIKYIDATFEADSQCAKLFLCGAVDGVISEDSDIILYGVTLYRNFFSKNSKITKYTMENIFEKLNLKQDDLIEISMLVGSDYTIGVENIGIKRAYEQVMNRKIACKDPVLTANVNEDWDHKYKVLKNYTYQEIDFMSTNSIDVNLYNQIYTIYKNPKALYVRNYENGEIDTSKLKKFLENEDSTGIMFHIEKLKSRKIL